MKNLAIDVLAKTGSILCKTAIKLAGRGDIKFEVYTKPEMPEFRFYQPPLKFETIKKIALILAVIAAMLAATHIAAATINEATDKLVKELRQEHRDTMKVLQWK